MATFLDNLSIIETAVYGKEMRPAIKEALLQSREYADGIVAKIDSLNKRVDSLSGDGGDIPDDPGGGGSTPTTEGHNVAGEAFEIIVAGVTNECYAGSVIEM